MRYKIKSYQTCGIVMIDKICINFIPGSLGHLVLKCIYHHWPTIFNQNTDLINATNHDNHEVSPDLFLKNTSRMSDEDIKLLQRLNDRKNIFLLCHDSDLIPQIIQKNFSFINIVYPDYDKSKINFLFVCKTKFIIDWARIKQKSGFDPYQIMFKELHRISQETIKIKPGINLDFNRLPDYQEIILALNSVKRIMNLPNYKFCREWYELQYTNSIEPLNKHKEFFDVFRYYHSVWSEADTRIDYREIFENYAQFEELIDFFFRLDNK